MDSQSIIVQANRDASCTEFPILSLPRPIPPTLNTQGLLPSCFLVLMTFLFVVLQCMNCMCLPLVQWMCMGCDEFSQLLVLHFYLVYWIEFVEFRQSVIHYAKRHHMQIVVLWKLTVNWLMCCIVIITFALVCKRYLVTENSSWILQFSVIWLKINRLISINSWRLVDYSRL